MTTMGTESFNAIIQAQMDWCMNKLVVKAVEYSEDDDRLHNFRVTAALRDTDMRDAVAGMMAKHTVSVYDMCNAIDLDDLDQWDEKIGDQHQLSASSARGRSGRVLGKPA